MRRMLALLLGTALAQSDFAQVTAQSVAVPRGTGVEIELLQDVSSDSLKAGQSIPFKLVRPIELNGETLLPATTPATGIVATVRKSGQWRKSGAFDLTLQPLKLVDGTLVHLDFYRPRRRGERMEKAGTSIGATMYFAYYFPLIPVALIAQARKGKPFVIRSGERYLVYVTSTEAAPAPAPAESPKP